MCWWLCGGVVENDQFAAVCRVILIAVHIKQVRQECAAIPGGRDDADERFFAVGVECFDEGLHDMFMKYEGRENPA